MKRYLYLVLCFLFSINTFCQYTLRGRRFYICQLPKAANKKVFHLQTRNDNVGIVMGKNWYRISDKAIDTLSVYAETTYEYGNFDTINVSVPEDGISFKLILSPYQKSAFENNTRPMHMSHNSHFSHYSHYSGK